MSKSESEASAKAPDEQQNDSVFDFLYQDARRIGSFLAQFDDSGHLQQVTQTENVNRGEKRGWKLSAGAGAGDFGNAQMAVERSPQEGGGESIERVYDPLWSNARTLLDFLHENDLIKRDISEARIGQFVLSRGDLTIADTALLQRLYGHESMKVRARNFLNPETGVPSPPEDVQLGLDALEEISPQVQAYLESDEGHIWCTLRPDGMITSAAEISMKYGISVDGEWYLLGIKDADDDGDIESMNERLEGLKASFPGAPFVTENFELNSHVRVWLGRPLSCFGVTPLAIFREIGN